MFNEPVTNQVIFLIPNQPMSVNLKSFLISKRWYIVGDELFSDGDNINRMSDIVQILCDGQEEAATSECSVCWQLIQVGWRWISLDRLWPLSLWQRTAVQLSVDDSVWAARWFSLPWHSTDDVVTCLWHTMSLGQWLCLICNGLVCDAASCSCRVFPWPANVCESYWRCSWSIKCAAHLASGRDIWWRYREVDTTWSVCFYNC